MLNNITASHCIVILAILITGCNSDQTEDKARYSSILQPTVCLQCPKIKTGQDTLTFVNEVRRFVAQNTDDGNLSIAPNDSFISKPIEQLDVDAYLNLFASNSSTAQCGLTAKLMVKILMENRIDAYTYNFGFADSELTHVVVLVKHHEELLVFDPYLNYALLNSDGSNMDVVDLILQTGSPKFKVFTTLDTVVSDILADFRLLDPSHIAMLNSANCASFIENRKEIRDSIYLISKNLCYQCDQQNECTSFIRKFEQRLRKETPFHDFHEGYYLKINALDGSADRVAVDSMINTVIAKQSSKLFPESMNPQKLQFSN